MKKFIDRFKKGTQYVNVLAAVTSNELTDIDASIDMDAYKNKKCVKFIPASGAATRMFKDLYAYKDDGTKSDSVDYFFDNLKKFAFYDEITEDIDNLQISDFDRYEDRVKIIDLILDKKLNYGNLPKSLIKMHVYDDLLATPIDEHIYEGEHYLNESKVDLHFTISHNHKDNFVKYAKNAIKDHPDVFIGYSYQKEKTDTLAVDMDNQPFVLDNGEVLYRAGGHGALIENLNDINADIIFIKNIDNVCHRSHANYTIASKKKLAAIGFEFKKLIDNYLLDLVVDEYDLDEIGDFIANKLHINCLSSLTRDMAIDFLNRPLRVCGLVRNQGEPGGGPFVVNNGDYSDLQICEKSELDLNDENVLAMLKCSEYFNPVDLVCFVKDYRNNKFNLLDYVNEDRYFISEKSYKGRKLKALEHPGLWNGAMHNWNTVFVEIPLSTFNPVKTVNDLLRDGHRE